MAASDRKFLQILPTLGHFRSIICLQGILPPKVVFEAIQLPVIAADGAYNLLEEMRIKVDAVVGDLDSVTAEIAPDVQKICIENQDLSDFQKALQYADETQRSPAIVFGMNGGCLDHVLHNAEIFSFANALSYSPPTLGIMVRENRAFHFEKGTKISLFAMPSALVSSKGLFWELVNQKLNFPFFSSSFNRCKTDTLEITVHEGSVLMVVYLEKIVDGGWSSPSPKKSQK
jgi:thiamine pyrophosphokinase